MEWMELLKTHKTEDLFEMLTDEDKQAVILKIESLLALQSSDQ